MKRFKTALLLISVLLISTGCSRMSPEELIASAKQNIEKGNMQSAVVELKNAISQNNNLAEARTLLGRVYLQQSQFEAAEKELLRGADMGAPYADVYPYLIKVYYYQEDFEGVISLADRIMLVLDDDIKPSLALYQYLAQVRIPEQNVNQIDIPEILQGDRKQLVDAYKAYLLRNYEEAKNIYNEFNQDSSDKVEQYFLGGLIHNRLDDLENSALDFEAVLKEYPNYHLVRFLLIDVLLRNESLDQAESHVDKLLAINNKQAQANYYKGAIAFQRKDFENAFFHAEKAREGRGEGLRNDMVHGLSAFKLEKYERAYSSLRRAANQLPKSHNVHRLVAQLQIKLGYTNEAASTLSSLDGLQEDDAVLFEAAAFLLAKGGSFEDSIEQYAIANSINENKLSSQMGEGTTRISTGDYSGIKNVQKAINLDPTNEAAWIVLAEALYEKGDEQKAVEVAKKWQEINGAKGLVLEAQIQQKMGNTRRSISALEEAMNLEPDSVPAVNNYLKVLRESGNYAKAVTSGKNALQKNPDNTYAARELLLSAKEQNQLTELNAFFANLASENPSMESPVLMQTSLLRMDGKDREATELLEKRKNILSIKGLRALGDAYFNIREFDKAEQIYMEWRETTPEQVSPWLRLIGVEEAKGERANSQILLDQALLEFPQSETLLLTNLHKLVSGGQMTRAEKELERLQSMGSTSTLLDRYEGELALHNKRYDEAVKILEPYYQTDMTIENALKLSLAYVGNNQKESAKELMQQQLANYPDSQNVKITIAEFMLVHEFYEDAILIYTEILKNTPNSIIALNNSATAQLRLGNNEKALSLSQSALAQAPEMPQLMDTHGQALLASGQVEESIFVLAAAHKKMPEDMGTALNLAEAYVAANQMAEASYLLSSVRPVNAKQIQKLKDLKLQVTTN